MVRENPPPIKLVGAPAGKEGSGQYRERQRPGLFFTLGESDVNGTDDLLKNFDPAYDEIEIFEKRIS